MLWILVACSNNPRFVDSVSDGMDAAGMTELDLGTESEALVITGDASTELTISVELATTRTKPNRDMDAMESLHLELRNAGDGIVRAAVWFDDKIDRYTTTTTVTIPSAMRVALSDHDGDVDITSVASLEIEDDDGYIHAEDVAGSVSIDDGGGDIVLRSVEGNVEIEDKDGDIKVSDVGGKVTINDGGGDIVIENAAKTEIESDGGGTTTVK